MGTVFIMKPATSNGASLDVFLTGTLGNRVISTSSVRVCGNVRVTSTTPSVDRGREVPRRLFRFLSLSRRCSITRCIGTTEGVVGSVSGHNGLPVVMNNAKLCISSLLGGVRFYDRRASCRLEQRLRRGFSGVKTSRVLGRLSGFSPRTTRELRPGGHEQVVHTFRICVGANGAFARRGTLSGRGTSRVRPLILKVACGGHRVLCSEVGHEISLVLRGKLFSRTGSAFKGGGGNNFRTVNRGRLCPTVSNRSALLGYARGLGRRAQHCTGHRLA